MNCYLTLITTLVISTLLVTTHVSNAEADTHEGYANSVAAEDVITNAIDELEELQLMELDDDDDNQVEDEHATTAMELYDTEGMKALNLLIEKDESDVLAISKALQAKGLSLAKLFSVRSAKGLMYRCLLPGIKGWVDTKIQTEYSMNIKTAFLLLGKVGELLRVSYAGCKGYHCQTKVAKVHSRYQNLIYDSARVSSNFVRNSIRAIRYHYYANRRMQRNQQNKALSWIKRTASIADVMVIESKKMVEQSEKLTQLSEEALLATTSDDVTNKNQIKDFQARMKNMTANVKRIQGMLQKQRVAEEEANKDVVEAVRNYKDWEKKHTVEAQRKIKENQKCKPMKQGVSIMGFGIGWTTKSCWDELDEGDVKQKQVKLSSYETQIKKARDHHLSVLKIKNGIQKRNADLYGELAQSLELKNLTAVKSDLERAQMSLEISIKVLTMVKTIFLEALSFWKKLSDQATTLGNKGDNMKVLKDLGLDDTFEFKELLVGSGFNWLAFGKVSEEAALTMRAVKGDVTAKFINLPSHEQAKMLIKTSGPLISKVQEMIGDLRKVETVTEKQIVDAEEAVKKEQEIMGVVPTGIPAIHTTGQFANIPDKR